MKLLNLLLEDYVVVKMDRAAAFAQGIINVLNLYGYVFFTVILIFLFWWFYVLESWLSAVVFLRLWLKLLCRRHDYFRLLFFLIFKILLKVHLGQSFVPSLQIVLGNGVVATFILLARRSLVGGQALLRWRVDWFLWWVHWMGGGGVNRIVVWFSIQNLTSHIKWLLIELRSTGYIMILLRWRWNFQAPAIRILLLALVFTLIPCILLFLFTVHSGPRHMIKLVKLIIIIKNLNKQENI